MFIVAGNNLFISSNLLDWHILFWKKNTFPLFYFYIRNKLELHSSSDFDILIIFFIFFEIYICEICDHWIYFLNSKFDIKTISCWNAFWNVDILFELWRRRIVMTKLAAKMFWNELRLYDLLSDVVLLLFFTYVVDYCS